MAEPLQPISIAAPGFLGLNKTASAVALGPEWALVANNVIINRAGRVSARNGWLKVTSAAIGGSPYLESGAEYIGVTGVSKFVWGANNVLYVGTTTLTNTYSTSITANRWQMVNFGAGTNAYLWLFQRSHAPLRYDGTNIVTIASLGGTGTPPQGNCVLAAFGRLWVADTASDQTVVNYSDLLIGQNWTGGSAGSLDVKSVLTTGVDTITALAAHQGYLIIFLRKSILIYSGATTPSSMTLVEHLKGLGCVARDSVAIVGDDIWFLSDSGIRSLKRATDTNNMPIADITKNVRDDIAYNVKNETNLENVRGVYHETGSFYAVTFPTQGITYWIDTREPLEDGTYRITTWTNITPRCYVSARDRELYLGQAGVVGRLYGYQDNTASYVVTYSTAWLDFERPELWKMLKRIKYTVIGANNTTFNITWSYDYASTQFVEPQTIVGGMVYEYSIAEYGIAEYSSGIQTQELSQPGKSAGKMIQLGLTCTVNGTELALQKIDAMAKAGRIF